MHVLLLLNGTPANRAFKFLSQRALDTLVVEYVLCVAVQASRPTVLLEVLQTDAAWGLAVFIIIGSQLLIGLRLQAFQHWLEIWQEVGTAEFKLAAKKSEYSEGPASNHGAD